tara:strand:- start:768 stop:1118 length:351 start_codon:yes stop_codon:yes gene_type:complete
MWVNVQDDIAIIGVTDDLQHIVGELESVDLPMVGDELEIDEDCVAFHVGPELYGLPSPLTGRVEEVNEALLDDPGKIFLAPYTSGWLYKMEYDEPEELELLMSDRDYVEFLEETDE